MKMLSAQIAQMTNGARVPAKWDLRREPTCVDEFCWNVSGCDAVMPSITASNPKWTCGLQASGDRFRMPNTVCDAYGTDPAGMALTLSHEYAHAQLSLGHCYEQIGPWANNDIGPYCGHSVMNGPQLSHTLCTGLNHCKDPVLSTVPPVRFYQPNVNPPTTCDQAGSNWGVVSSGGTVPSSAVPAIGYSPDQWDSLRKNSNWMRDILVLDVLN